MAFSVLYHLPDIPFNCKWYAIVRWYLKPRSLPNSEKREDLNCIPWSVIWIAGTPMRGVHFRQRASAQYCAAMSFSMPQYLSQVPTTYYAIAHLDLALVLLSGHKAPTASVNSEMVAVNAVTICCSWATWLELSRDTSPNMDPTWASWILSAVAANVFKHPESAHVKMACMRWSRRSRLFWSWSWLEIL